MSAVITASGQETHGMSRVSILVQQSICTINGGASGMRDTVGILLSADDTSGCWIGVIRYVLTSAVHDATDPPARRCLCWIRHGSVTQFLLFRRDKSRQLLVDAGVKGCGKARLSGERRMQAGERRCWRLVGVERRL